MAVEIRGTIETYISDIKSAKTVESVEFRCGIAVGFIMASEVLDAVTKEEAKSYLNRAYRESDIRKVELIGNN